jgi:hypothetical protein
MDIRYSVYSVKDDMPIVIAGTVPKCAKMLGLTIDSFYSQASKQRKGKYSAGSKRKYRIVREDDNKDEV